MSELYCDWLLLVCSARGIQVANPLYPVFAWRKDFFVHITASALCPGYNLLTLYKRWLLSEFKGMTGWIVGWQSRTLGVQEVLVNEELNLSASLFFSIFRFYSTNCFHFFIAPEAAGVIGGYRPTFIDVILILWMSVWVYFFYVTIGYIWRNRG